jgi:hypothetical protein
MKTRGLLSRVSTRGTLTNAYNETIRTHARPSTAAASKTEIASSESVRARATTAVEYGSGLERTERRRAQGHCPPPDARTRARAFNAPDASPPNTRVTGGVIGNKLMSHRSFCSLPTERPRACQDAGNKDGTSNRDPLETPKVSAPDIDTSYGVRPSTSPGSFLETSRASTDHAVTAPPDLPPSHISVHPPNQSKTARRAECRGTRDHHQAIKTGRLEVMPVRKPRVGQRSMLLSTPIPTPIHVP